MAEEILDPNTPEEEIKPVLEKMNVGELITQRIPAVEEVLSASKWFADEVMELDFGEYVGRPSENALMHTSLLTYFLANGWKIKEVKKRFADGEWESRAESNGTNGVVAHSSTEAESYAKGKTISNTGDRVAPDGEGGTVPVVRAESETSSSGSSTSEGESSSTGSFANVSISGGAPYWCAYQTVVLTRRKMQSELVLNDMIASFTKAYNEGRSVNNARYDELVALYSLMLSHTEDEANRIPLDALKPDDLIALGDELASSFSDENGIKLEEIRPIYDSALENIRAAITALKDAVTIPANWLKSREDDINLKFDNEKNKINSTMIANGSFADSTWANIVSGIERDRHYALNNLADTMVTLKVDTYGKIATLTADSEGKLLDVVAKLVNIETSLADLKVRIADIRARLMESAARIIEALQKNQIGLTELRNTVLKWMFDFMERREDDYPGLEQLATIADRLGYSDGAVGGSISS
jgi:hypothetical protein